MFLAVFFITFVSCPMKRLIRIELGLPVPPLSAPVSATGDHDANNIKDCNMNKHEYSQKVVLTVQQAPNPSLPPAIVFLSYLCAANDLSVTAGEATLYTTRQFAIGNMPDLYLRQGRMQV